MNVHDHRTDVVAALRQPALPAERAGEAAAVASMAAAMPVSAGTVRRLPPKGAAIVVVTAASLGVGGLVAAGPGFFPSVFNGPDEPELIDDQVVDLPDAVTQNPASPAAPDVVPGGDGAAVPGVSPATPDRSNRPEGADPTLPDAATQGQDRAAEAQAKEKCAEPPVGADANASPDEAQPPTDPGARVPDVAADCASDATGDAGTQRPADAGKPDVPEPDTGKPEDPGPTADEGDRPDRPDTPEPSSGNQNQSGDQNPSGGESTPPGAGKAGTKGGQAKAPSD